MCVPIALRVLLLGLVSTGWVAVGAGTPVAVGFEGATAKVLDSNQRLKALREACQGTAASIVHAGALPSPELEIATENLGVSEVEVAITVPVELGGKRGIRRAAARAQDSIARYQFAAEEISLKAETMRRYALAAALTTLIHRFDSLIVLASIDSERVALRVETGAAMGVDLVRAQLALEATRLRRHTVTVERDLACASLAALWGDTSVTYLPSDTLVGDVPVIDDESVNQGVETHPVLGLIRSEQGLDQAELDESRSERLPELALTGGYLRNNEAGENAGLLGVSIELPMFGRGRQRVQAQRHAVESVRLAAGADELDRRQDLRRALAAIALAGERMTYLDRTAIPGLEKVCATLSGLYARGMVGIIDVLESRGELLELQIESVEARLQLAEQAADLLELSGHEVDVFEGRTR